MEKLTSSETKLWTGFLFQQEAIQALSVYKLREEDVLGSCQSVDEGWGRERPVWRRKEKHLLSMSTLECCFLSRSCGNMVILETQQGKGGNSNRNMAP